MWPRSFYFLRRSQHAVPAFRPLDEVAEPRAERASPRKEARVHARNVPVSRITVAEHASIARSNRRAFAREHASASRTVGDPRPGPMVAPGLEWFVSDDTGRDAAVNTAPDARSAIIAQLRLNLPRDGQERGRPTSSGGCKRDLRAVGTHHPRGYGAHDSALTRPVSRRARVAHVHVLVGN